MIKMLLELRHDVPADLNMLISPTVVSVALFSPAIEGTCGVDTAYVYITRKGDFTVHH
ncbi:MAG: hypothetical protein ABIP64_05735 [Burkholderiales bacterium]